MRRTVLLAALLLSTAGPALAGPGFPRGVEEPLRVSAAVQVRQVGAVDDGSGRFQATVDLRLLWRDPGLAFTPAPGELARLELSGPEARERLDRMWLPEVRIDNMAEPLDDAVEEEGLLLESDGRVQWYRLLAAEFAAPFDHRNFPFDRQVLPLRFVSAREDAHRLVLECDPTCRELSGLSAPDPQGWRLGHFRIAPGAQRSWSGSLHSALTVEIQARRSPDPYYATLFMPLFATMIVPLLSVWLNRWDGRRLAIEAFELMNLAVAGLFATIALNLAVFSTLPFLVGAHNLVSQLFMLNYLLLAVAMLAILTFFRNQSSSHPWPDPYLSRELFLALCWTLPLLTAVAVAALVRLSLA